MKGIGTWISLDLHSNLPPSGLFYFGESGHFHTGAVMVNSGQTFVNIEGPASAVPNNSRGNSSMYHQMNLDVPLNRLRILIKAFSAWSRKKSPPFVPNPCTPNRQARLTVSCTNRSFSITGVERTKG